MISQGQTQELNPLFNINLQILPAGSATFHLTLGPPVPVDKTEVTPYRHSGASSPSYPVIRYDDEALWY
jgi:hypothetical protein